MEMDETLIEHMNLTEALLFASPEPVDYKKISHFLGKAAKKDIYEVITRLNEKYTEGGHSFRIREIADGFQLCLLPNMTLAVEKYFKRQRERRLTQAGLETLAIISYKQPVTKGEVEHIRGVNIDGPLTTLLERKLVTIIGRSEKVGHPLLYGTTKKFLEYFGLKNIDELPKLEEFAEKYRSKTATPQQELELESDSENDPDANGEGRKIVMKRPEEEYQDNQSDSGTDQVAVEELNET